MTQDQNAAAHTDALLARYHAAQAALDTPEASGPSAQTRAHILDCAAQIATISGAAPAMKERASSQFDTRKTAANDGQWKIRALATVAIFGLTSLLLLQWDRGTPEEKDLAFSTARPPEAAGSDAAAAPATAPSPAPSHAPLSAPAITPPTAATTSNAAKAVAPARARDKIESEAGQASASGTLSKAAPTLSAKDEAAVAQAIAPPVALPPQLAAPAPEAAAPIAAAPAAPRAPTMRAAPAAKAAEYGAAQSQRGDDAPNAALFAAIRSGDAAAVQQALANGADKNAKSNGTPAIALCVQANRLAMVRLLAAAGADLNTLDAQGLSPLAHAQAKGMDGMATLLLELGAK
jgi:Ankyrin repeats (3 copies)